MAGAAGKFTPQLLWPELIITSGIIFRLRIAESGDTAGPGVGADRKPHGTEKVGAGLHHDDRIGGANDAEAELPGGHAGRLRLRIPQNRRHTSKSGTPASGS